MIGKISGRPRRSTGLVVVDFWVASLSDHSTIHSNSLHFDIFVFLSTTFISKMILCFNYNLYIGG